MGRRIGARLEAAALRYLGHLGEAVRDDGGTVCVAAEGDGDAIDGSRS
jgi:hypothetical protein